MKKKEKHLSLRIEEELLRKFEYVARYDERSMNWMMNSMIRKMVEAFEQEHGTIDVQDKTEEKE